MDPVLLLSGRIIEMLSSRSKIRFETPPDDDSKRCCPDISKAKELLSLEPAMPLEEGLHKTTDYFIKKTKVI